MRHAMNFLDMRFNRFILFNFYLSKKKIPTTIQNYFPIKISSILKKYLFNIGNLISNVVWRQTAYYIYVCQKKLRFKKIKIYKFDSQSNVAGFLYGKMEHIGFIRYFVSQKKTYMDSNHFWLKGGVGRTKLMRSYR
jgi:hypothetical protein